MMARKFLIFSACLLSLFMTGCGGMKDGMLSNAVQKPEVSIDTIGISGLSPGSIDLVLSMDVTNPNNYALALAGYDYDVTFNGMPLVNGSTDQGFRIPARQTDQIRIPLTIAFSDARKIYDSIGENGEVSYNADVDLRLDAPVLNLFKIKTNKQGSLTIPRFPKISFGDIQVKRFSFSDIELALNMAVDNPNDFTMDLKDLVYQISVSGRQWLSGGVDNTLSIGGKQVSNVTIPLRVKLSELSSGLLSSLRSGSFGNFAVDGSFVLDGDHSALKNIKVPINFQKNN
jgi:LEA14-like dessication related protein